MHRALRFLGSIALLLAACHGGGSSSGTMDPNDPMYPMDSRPMPTLQRRAATCAAPVRQRFAATPTGCDRTP